MSAFEDARAALDVASKALDAAENNPLVKASAAVNALPDEAIEVLAGVVGQLDSVVKDHVAKQRAEAVAEAATPPDPEQ